MCLQRPCFQVRLIAFTVPGREGHSNIAGTEPQAPARKQTQCQRQGWKRGGGASFLRAWVCEGPGAGSTWRDGFGRTSCLLLIQERLELWDDFFKSLFYQNNHKRSRILTYAAPPAASGDAILHNQRAITSFGNHTGTFLVTKGQIVLDRRFPTNVLPLFPKPTRHLPGCLLLSGTIAQFPCALRP